MELVVQGQIDEGVAELEQAYETLPHPNVLYNIARAYAEAGRYEEALEFFERYLATDPPDAAEARGFVSAIETRLAAQATARAEAQTRAVEGQPREGSSTEGALGEGGTGASLEATAENIDELRVSAAHLSRLSQVVGSPTLEERATRLRAMADELEARLAAGETGAAGRGAIATRAGADGAAGTAPVAGAAGAEQDALSIGAGQTDLYEETFVSSTRFAQNPLDAPNSTTIITRQDIRMTGITQLGELLRRVPGVQVMTTSPGETNIAMRGFNQRLSPRVLMLVNGRSTYVDLLGITPWQQQPIAVEDIERIEVIRGPASALYGANGFSGIVNIITRTPGDEPGVELAGGIGSSGQARIYTGANGRVGRLGYRLSAGWDTADRFSVPLDLDRVDAVLPDADPNVANRNARAFGQITYRIDRDTSLYAEGGVSYATPTTQAGTSVFNDLYLTGPISFAMAGISTGWGGVRFFWNGFDIEASQFGVRRFDLQLSSNVYDVEANFARRFHTGSLEHNLTFGAGYRRKQASWNIFREDAVENHYQAFLQDSVQLSSAVSFVGGIRMDRHPLLTRPVFSPRGAFVFRVGEAQSIRTSVSTAFRTFSFLESYVYAAQPTPVTAVAAWGLGNQHAHRDFGVPRLAPERILSAELGYMNSESDYFSFDVALYFNRVSDVINLGEQTRPFTLADAVDPRLDEYTRYNRAQDTYMFGPSGFENDPSVFYVGGSELSVRVFPVRGLDLYANYTANVTYRMLDGEAVRDYRTPTHQLNAGIQYRATFGMDLALDVHYQTETTWREQVVGESAIETHAFDLPGYSMINGRIGWRLLDEKLAVGITGYNIGGLWTSGVRQHPFTQQLDARVMGTVSYRF